MVQSAVSETVCRMGSKSGDENTKPGKQKMSRSGTIMSWNRRMPTPESFAFSAVMPHISAMDL